MTEPAAPALDLANFGSSIGDDALMQYLAHWQATRAAGDVLPQRSALQPVALGPLLPRLIIMEAGETGTAVIRLAGTGYREALGFELTGLDFLALAAPDAHATRARRIRAIAQTPCGAWFRLLFPAPDGKQRQFDFLVLPWSVPGQLPHLVGVASTQGRGWPAGADSRRRVAGHADDFRFVDLGAGTPADEGE